MELELLKLFFPEELVAHFNITGSAIKLQPVKPEEAVKRTINWINSNAVKVLGVRWKASFKD